MGCDRIREWIPAFVLDELSQSERQEVIHHLRSCEICAAEESAVAEAFGSLGGIPDPSTSADRRERAVDAMLRAHQGDQEAVTPRRLRRFGRWPGLVAAGLLIAFSFLFGAVIASYQLGDSTLKAELGPASGTVQVLRAANTGWESLYTGDRIHTGERIQTRSDGYAVLRMGKGGEVEMDALASVMLDPVVGGVDLPVITLFKGSLFVDGSTSDSMYVIRTSEGVVTARQSTFEVRMDESMGHPLRLRVAKGEARISSSEGSHTVVAGQEAELGVGPEDRIVEVDTEEIAPWRARRSSRVNPGVTSLKRRLPMPTVEVKVVGETEDGKKIVEYIVPRAQLESPLGEAGNAHIQTEDQKVRVIVGEDEEFVIPVRVHISEVEEDRE